MTDHEAVVWLNTALVEMKCVHSSLYMAPGHRDAWWRLGTAIEELENAVSKLQPVVDGTGEAIARPEPVADEEPLSPLARDVFDLGLALSKLHGSAP